MSNTAAMRTNGWTHAAIGFLAMSCATATASAAVAARSELKQGKLSSSTVEDQSCLSTLIGEIIDLTLSLPFFTSNSGHAVALNEF